MSNFEGRAVLQSLVRMHVYQIIRFIRQGHSVVFPFRYTQEGVVK